MLFLTLTLVALGGLAIASVLEGLLHQFILHRGQKKLFGGALYPVYHKHSNEHHPEYRGESYHQPAPEQESKISLGPFLLPITYVLTSPVSVALWFLSPWATLTFMVTLALYYLAYEFLHWHMHFTRPDGKPRSYHSWSPSRQLFEWFNVRHYIHHSADDRNFNVVMPLYDLLIGTYTVAENVAPRAVRRRREMALARSAKLRRERN